MIERNIRQDFFMKNIELKRELLKNGKFKRYTSTRKKLFNSKIDDPETVLKTLLNDFSDEELKQSERIRRNKQEQRKTIQNHIEYLFQRKDMDIYFATFNFSNDTLNETKAETRKQKVRRTASATDDFILNIDYGSQTEREHYHAIIAVLKNRKEEHKPDGKHIKLKCLDSYNYGFYDLQKVRRGDKDKEKLSKYIAKLTAHSLKVKQQYVSVKKGSDYQKYQADKKTLIEDATKRKAITEKMINQKHRYIDQPQQTNFKEELKEHSKMLIIQTTLGDIKYHERRLQ